MDFFFFFFKLSSHSIPLFHYSGRWTSLKVLSLDRIITEGCIIYRVRNLWKSLLEINYRNLLLEICHHLLPGLPWGYILLEIRNSVRFWQKYLCEKREISYAKYSSDSPFVYIFIFRCSRWFWLTNKTWIARPLGVSNLVFSSKFSDLHQLKWSVSTQFI